jgi:uncharacterized membrane protein
MRRRLKLYLLALALVVGVTPWARAEEHQGVTFTTIDFPAATFTETNDINARGDVVGRYVRADGTSHGYLLSNGRFITIDFPGAVFTSPKGVNTRGDIVGDYRDPHGRNHAFLLSKGSFTAFDVPGDTDTFHIGINSDGDIVGNYCNHPCDILSVDVEDRLPSYGYLLRNGELTVFGVPLATATGAFRIDARGNIVGSYWDISGQPHGYLLSEGRFTPIDLPDANGTYALGINAQGDIVGSYCISLVFRPKCTFRINDNHAYLLSDGTFTALDLPGAPPFTRAWGINSRGDIAGSYRDISNRNHGFVLSAGQRDEDSDSDRVPPQR